MNTPSHHDKTGKFWQKLYALKNANNRGDIAQLKNALTQERYDLALPVIGDTLPSAISQREIRLYAFVAGLFALHPIDKNKERGLWTLGQSAQALGKKLNAGKDSLDKRFTALLNADDDDVFALIQQIVRQCASKDVSIHYPTLLQDLISWRREDRRTQMKWATHYWVNKDSQEFDDTENIPEETGNDHSVI